MVNVLFTVTSFASLATIVSSFSTYRQSELDELIELRNNNSLFHILEVLRESSSISPNSRNFIPTAPPESVSDPDPLSVVWYLGAFGGLIAFFLVVTFSEWCCASKHLYRRHALSAPYLTGSYSTESRTPDTPPPPYHLFAPPPYAEAAITYCEKSAQETATAAPSTTTPQPPPPPPPIYIIPVHQQPINAAALLPPPPPYPAAVALAPPTAVCVNPMVSTTIDMPTGQMAAVPS